MLCVFCLGVVSYSLLNKGLFRSLSKELNRSRSEIALLEQLFAESQGEYLPYSKISLQSSVEFKCCSCFLAELFLVGGETLPLLLWETLLPLELESLLPLLIGLHDGFQAQIMSLALENLCKPFLCLVVQVAVVLLQFDVDLIKWVGVFIYKLE